jgi:hypothetical protein
MTHLGDRAPAHALLEKLRDEVTLAPPVDAPFSSGRPRVPPHAESWYVGIQGELQVANLLDELPAGWLVLHSVPLGDGTRDIDHVVVSPGGRVMTLNTKRHSGASIWAAHDALMVNGSRQAHIPRARDEGQRASARLSSALDRAVTVEPMVVFTGERSLTVKESPAGVTLVSSGDLIRMLKRFDDEGDPSLGEAVKKTAAESSTWTSQPLGATSSTDLILWFMTLDRPAGSVRGTVSQRSASSGARPARSTPSRDCRPVSGPASTGTWRDGAGRSTPPYVVSRPSGNGLAIAALVLGLVAVVFALIPLAGAFLCWLPAVLAIVFGALGIGAAKRLGGYRRSLAIWGLLCGVLALPIVIMEALWLSAIVASAARS